MDTSRCWGGDLSAVLRGKVAVVGGRVCRVPGFAQIADHLTQNSPFLPFFGEVVCTLGGAASSAAESAHSDCADTEEGEEGNHARQSRRIGTRVRQSRGR